MLPLIALLSSHFVLSTSAASISTDLQNGICLCVNEPNVKAVRNPYEPSSQVALLSNGACFRSNGGIYHNSNGETWYELVDMSNGQKGWVDSFYLNVYLVTVCNSSANVTTQPFHTPSATPDGCTINGTNYAHGQRFTSHNMECICDDGAALCSLGGKHCLSAGIVHKDGQRFTTDAGLCDCKQGTVLCENDPGFGK